MTTPETDPAARPQAQQRPEQAQATGEYSAAGAAAQAGAGPAAQHPGTPSARPPLQRTALWVAVAAMLAAAVICVFWVLLGDSGGIVVRAFLTVALVAAFAGVTLLDASEAPRRPSWYVLASMGGWVLLLLAGAVTIWIQERAQPYDGVVRFSCLLVLVLVVRLALLHIRLFLRAHLRHVTTATRAITIGTVVVVILLVLLLAVPLTVVSELHFPDFYWRVIASLAILGAVGTALVPLINALSLPRAPRTQAYGYGGPVYGTHYGAPGGPGGPGTAGGPVPGAASASPQPGAAGVPSQPGAAPGAGPLPWPRYADGVTPLPVLPDGQPDWQAYYTGVPSALQGRRPQGGVPPQGAGWAPPAPQAAPVNAPVPPPASGNAPVPPPAPPQPRVVDLGRGERPQPPEPSHPQTPQQ